MLLFLCKPQCDQIGVQNTKGFFFEEPNRIKLMFWFWPQLFPEKKIKNRLNFQLYFMVCMYLTLNVFLIKRCSCIFKEKIVNFLIRFKVILHYHIKYKYLRIAHIKINNLVTLGQSQESNLRYTETKVCNGGDCHSVLPATRAASSRSWLVFQICTAENEIHAGRCCIYSHDG